MVQPLGTIRNARESTEIGETPVGGITKEEDTKETREPTL